MKKFFLAFVIATASAFAWALPTVQQVEAEVQQGRTVQAESMMSEVVAAKPASARAHYIYAEILARNKKFAKASEEAKTARQLDPDLKFTQPEKFRAFEQLLEKEQRPPARTQPAPSQQRSTPAAATATKAVQEGIPSWVWLAGLAVVGFAVWRLVAGSTAATRAAALPGAVAPPNPGVNGPIPPGSAYAPSAVQTPAPGGGLLGTGLAAAGGVAGGMLLGEMLRGRSGSAGNPLTGGAELGNITPSDTASAASELETRQVDFGSGNDWDAGTANGGADGGENWDS